MDFNENCCEVRAQPQEGIILNLCVSGSIFTWLLSYSLHVCFIWVMSSCPLFPLSLSGAVIPQSPLWMSSSSSFAPPATRCVKPPHSFVSLTRLANVQGMQRWLIFAAASSCQYLMCSLLVNTSITDWLDYVVCQPCWPPQWQRSYWLNEQICCWVTDWLHGLLPHLD